MNGVRDNMPRRRGRDVDKRVRGWMVVFAAGTVAPCIDGVSLTPDLSGELQKLSVDACSRFQCGGDTDAFDAFEVVPRKVLRHAGDYAFQYELQYRLHFVAYGQLSFEVVSATRTKQLASSDARQLMLLLTLGLLRGLNIAS
jgi:hypothetical protein